MPNIGDPAPNFTDQDFITNQTISLSDYEDQVVLLAFSGITWCPPCQYEAPILEDLWQEFIGGTVPPVQFLLISCYDDLNVLPQSLQDYGITFPVLTDQNIRKDYEVSSFPTLYMVDTDQKICGIHQGAGPPESALKTAIRNELYDCGVTEIDFSGRHWVAVAEILFGVTQDGGGVVISGGKPIPVPPWDPLRSPAKRDILFGLAINELAGSISDPRARKDLKTRALKVVNQGSKRLSDEADRAHKPVKQANAVSAPRGTAKVKRKIKTKKKR